MLKKFLDKKKKKLFMTKKKFLNKKHFLKKLFNNFFQIDGTI